MPSGFDKLRYTGRVDRRFPAYLDPTAQRMKTRVEALIHVGQKSIAIAVLNLVVHAALAAP